jgi:hypothetical protein
VMDVSPNDAGMLLNYIPQIWSQGKKIRNNTVLPYQTGFRGSTGNCETHYFLPPYSCFLPQLWPQYRARQHITGEARRRS